MLTSPGIHHVTAIASDAQTNLDFYTQTLGLRLVKLTVNFDDPTSYHFYYGDSSGKPGSILTFFAWPGAGRARAGRGVVETTWLRVPQGSLPWWKNRLDERGVWNELRESGLALRDPDGLNLELRESEISTEFEPWTREVPLPYAVRGIGGVILRVGSSEATQAVLTRTLGLESRNGAFFSQSGDAVEMLSDERAPRASMGAGGVHHVAFRSRDDDEQFAGSTFFKPRVLARRR
jgi:glyoxalase family protein